MYKSALIDKIASCVGIDSKHPQSDDVKVQALKVASEMLKVAAENQRALQFKVAQLSMEIDDYKKDKAQSLKKARVESIVSQMFENDMIKKSDIESKIQELENMDSEALDVFEKTISSIPKKASEEYVSDLTFLYGDNNIIKKDTLDSAIGNFIK